jgi:subtilisin family serine protease
MNFGLRRLSIPILFVFLFIATASQAQTKYWVFFKDKDGSSFNPYAFFDEKAIERREKLGISLADYTDLPVNSDYIRQVAGLADSMGNVSRWFNGVGVWISPGKIDAIRGLPFVKEVVQMNVHLEPTGANEADTAKDTSLLKLQLIRMQGAQFLDKGFHGKGIRIAVLDVGFRGALKHPAFKHLYANDQIKGTYDFIKHDSDVYGYGEHGTMVLSCIAGMQKDTPMGLAQDAEFLLARTERNFTELKDEEDSWLAAIEWADKNGAHIVSSSLGYTNRRYFQYQMDGQTSLVSRAANLAARKGMLVVIAAGNEARSRWKYICTPGDADSALTVGATDPKTNYHANFSSFGPSADGRLKPNVVAPGIAWVADKEDYSSAMGTSFATPLVAGFAACAWGMFPDWSNMELFEAIEHSGELYPYFDYAHGYGTPQASYFMLRKFNENGPRSPVKGKEATFHFDTTNYDFAIIPHSPNPEDSTLHIGLEEKLFYYEVLDTNRKIVRYYVIKPAADPYGDAGHLFYPITLDWDNIPEHGTIRAHFDGYTNEQSY